MLKIEFSNESVIEIVENSESIRGNQSKNIEWLHDEDDDSE